MESFPTPHLFSLHWVSAPWDQVAFGSLEALKIGTGHLLEANPLIYRMGEPNSWRSVHQGGKT